MSTKTKELKPSPSKKATGKQTTEEEKKTKSKVTEIIKSETQINSILNPTAEGRVKKLETLNRLAQKKIQIDTKLDELTNYRASNDGTQSKMEFRADNGYSFSISNPLTINGLLLHVETELFELQAKTNSEILNFQI